MKKRKLKKRPPKKEKTYIEVTSVACVPIFFCKDDGMFYTKINGRYTAQSETLRSCKRHAQTLAWKVKGNQSYTGVPVVYSIWRKRTFKDRWVAGVVDEVVVHDRGQGSPYRFDATGNSYWIRLPNGRREKVPLKDLCVGTADDAERLNQLDEQVETLKAEQHNAEKKLKRLHKLSKTAVTRMVNRLKKAA